MDCMRLSLPGDDEDLADSACLCSQARVAALAAGAGFGVGYAISETQNQFNTHKAVVDATPSPVVPKAE